MIKAVIFDLGNVLLNFDHQIIFQRLEEHLPSPDVLRWMGRKIKRIVFGFETGVITSDEFYRELNATVRFSELPQEAFEKKWAEIFWKNEELLDVIASLKNNVALHMLSNTNPLHYTYAQRAFPEVFEPFTTHTLSFDAGTAKPDQEIFRKTLAVANVQPEECLYFDDIQRYISGARAMGIHAHQYVSVAGVRDVCAMYDLEV